ncbi:unnamed protein product [Mortierella alpina]
MPHQVPNRLQELRVLECSLEHENSRYTKALAKLLTLNTDIIVLSIGFSNEDLQIHDEEQLPNIGGIKQVALALPYLASLQYLSVETPGIFGHIDLLLFLTCLPQWVKGFKFMQHYPRDNEVDDAPYALSANGVAWRGDVYSNLTDLEFGEFEHYDLTPFLIPLLQRCPRLIRLTLPIIPGPALQSVAEVLRGNCSNLRFLTIVGHLQEEDLLPMVKAVPALTTLDLPISVPSTAAFMPQMVAKWSNTLTSLTLGAGVIVQSSDIQLLLTSCPRFESLWMTPHGAVYNPRTVTDHYSPLNLSDLAQSEWTCVGLEALCIIFHDERVEQDTLEQHLEQEERTREWIRKAYGQLGKLTRLETLQLGWGHPFREGEDGDSLVIHKPGPVVHMDFSMASGLALLKGMSSLKKLSLVGMARLSLGDEELEWIQGTWPHAEITGLDRKSADWLQVQRFGLNLQQPLRCVK